MFLHEWAQRCSTCQEVTPHVRRRIAGPKFAAALAAFAAAWCFWQDRSGWFTGAALAVGAAWVFLRDRDSLWGIHCSRCRDRGRRELKRTTPTLDGRTEW